VAKFRPGRVGILRRTDSWLRLTDIPLFQPANLRT
jgi:hypothetical protein